MNAFNDHLTIDMVNDLLKTLNIYAERNPTDSNVISLWSNNYLVVVKPISGIADYCIESYSLDGLLERIFACDKFEIVCTENGKSDWKTIDNIYYGCKNLEEAFIRKDLTYGNQ